MSIKKEMRTTIPTESFGDVVVIYKGTRKGLEKRIRDYGRKELVDKGYVKLFGEPSEKISCETVREDIETKILKLGEFLSKDALSFWFEEFKLKKNGKFMKGSVVKIFDLEYCARFYLNEGYKYKVPRLQLKAISENEVEIIFEERWESF